MVSFEYKDLKMVLAAANKQKHSESMLFVDYRLILVFGIPITFILLSVGGYRAMHRKQGSIVWRLARIGAAGFASLSCLLLLVVGYDTAFTKTTTSVPLFSADGKHAIRVTDFDAGGLGGDTSVSLFSDHGFKNRTILSGGWKIVEAQDIHWQNNSAILVEYPPDTGYDPPTCRSFSDIKVTCQASKRQTWQN